MNFEESLGHVFARFGIEIRTAACMTLRRRQLHAPFEAWVQALLASGPQDIRGFSYAIDSDLNTRPAGFHD